MQLQRESANRGYAARAREKQMKVGMGLMCEVEKVLQVSSAGEYSSMYAGGCRAGNTAASMQVGGVFM